MIQCFFYQYNYRLKHFLNSIANENILLTCTSYTCSEGLDHRPYLGLGLLITYLLERLSVHGLYIKQFTEHFIYRTLYLHKKDRSDTKELYY